MEKFYIQKLGQNRIVQIQKGDDKEVILHDIKTGLVYCMGWDSFGELHDEMEKYITNVEYDGPNLDIN